MGWANLQQGGGASDREDSEKLLNWEMIKEEVAKWWRLGYFKLCFFLRGWIFSCLRTRYLFYKGKIDTLIEIAKKLFVTKPHTYNKGKDENLTGNQQPVEPLFCHMEKEGKRLTNLELMSLNSWLTSTWTFEDKYFDSQRRGSW